MIVRRMPDFHTMVDTDLRGEKDEREANARTLVPRAGLASAV